MIQEFSFKAHGKSFTLVFTARARYLFESASRYPLTRLLAWKGEVSDIEAAQLLWAGLEGWRVRAADRKHAWTIDEVLDEVLSDLSADERFEVNETVMRAINAAFQRATPATEEGAASSAGKSTG